MTTESTLLAITILATSLTLFFWVRGWRERRRARRALRYMLWMANEVSQITDHIRDIIEAEKAGDTTSADQLRAHLREVHGVEEQEDPS